jgi:hypothetical protein
MKDMSNLKPFLIEAEALTIRAIFKKLSICRQRSMLFPGDIGAPLVTIKALRGLGRRAEAAQIIQDLRETLDRLISIIQDVDVEECYDVVDVQTIQDISPDLVFSASRVPRRRGERSLPQDAYSKNDETNTIDDGDTLCGLGSILYPTMAELLRSSGHIDMAHEIYSGLLKKHPMNPVYKNGFKDLSSFAPQQAPKEDPEKQRLVIDELEKWINKIKKPN